MYIHVQAVLFIHKYINIYSFGHAETFSCTKHWIQANIVMIVIKQTLELNIIEK